MMILSYGKKCSLKRDSLHSYKKTMEEQIILPRLKPLDLDLANSACHNLLVLRCKIFSITIKERHNNLGSIRLTFKMMGSTTSVTHHTASSSLIIEHRTLFPIITRCKLRTNTLSSPSVTRGTRDQRRTSSKPH